MAPTFLEGERGLAILRLAGRQLHPDAWCCSATLNWIEGRRRQAIVAAPRFHQQYQPDAIFAEPDALTAEERIAVSSHAGTACDPGPRRSATCR